MKTVLTINDVELTDVMVLSDPLVDLPVPVVEWASVPGGVDVDVTAVLSDGVPTFGRRSVKVSCMVQGLSLWEAQGQLGGLSGQEVDLGLQELAGKHLHGRLSWSDWSWPGKGEAVLFTLNLDAEPYWYDDALTSVKVAASASPGTMFSLAPTGYTVMPQAIVTGAAVTLVIGSSQTQLLPGKWDWLDVILLVPGKPVSGRVVGAATSAVTFEWRGGTPG